MSKKKTILDDFNIFVAGKTGAFKGINVNDKNLIVKNLQNIQILKPENEISVLSWGDNKENDILIGTVNQVVRIYDIDFKAYSTSIETKIGTGPLVGLTRINGAITTCSQSGHVKVWRSNKKEQLELEVGGDCSKMQHYCQNEGIIATGGQKNDLKIWNLETKQKIFCAKNVKKDMLELEVPIWVSDISFMPDCDYKVAVSTRHGQIRMYDTKAQRRPVVDINLQERSLNTISLCHKDYHVVVGSATGHVMLADLRGKGKIVHAYKGAVGSIRQVSAHPELPFVASVGLDRFLRVHHLETKQLLHQQYLKVRLNCVLMKSSFGKEVEKHEKEGSLDENEDIECIELESDEEYKEMFEQMERVGEKEKKRKKSKVVKEKESKKIKKM